MREANYERIISAMAALSAHKLNVTIIVVNEDEHRSAVEDMGARNGRLVLSKGITRKVYHSGKLQARC